MLRTTSLIAVVVVLAGSLGVAGAADLKVVKSQKTKDVSVSVLSESGQWKPGKNEFVVAFASAKDNSPVDVGKVTLNTSMAMPGMAPMVAGCLACWLIEVGRPSSPPGDPEHLPMESSAST